MENITSEELLTIKNHELELENLKIKCELKLSQFQMHVDALWIRYGLKKGVDKIQTDGSIVRAETQTVEG